MREIGKTIRRADSYPYLTLVALITEQDTAKEEFRSGPFSVIFESQAPHWTDAPPTHSATGDPLVDKWERQIAAGIDPDLDEEI